MAFAKLFETEDMGQILVMVGQSPECVPEIRTWVQPAGLAPCSIAFGFEDSEAGEAQSYQAFERFDLDHARKAAKAVFDMLASRGDADMDGDD